MTVIICCSSLEEFLDAAQKKAGTNYPVVYMDRALHAEPADMKDAVIKAINDLPEDVDTVLVAMGFCGGVWDHVSFPRRVVIPRVDDCVSMLLTCSDDYCANRKENGHLYLYESDPSKFSALTLLKDGIAADESLKGMDWATLKSFWFGNYHYMDIIDTGLNDCYSESYAQAAQDEADKVDAALDYVPGSIRMLEKLVSGRWDSQFLVAEPGQLIKHGDFFE